ncbi:MAG: hypothetical protein JNL94_00015, partial [Planctomycetes bacterium]|nr:hypothetical protein [Planctomycetota bacterium]
YAIVGGSLPVAWLCVALLARRRRALAADPHRIRRRTAADTARAKVREAANAEPNVALDRARDALVGLVAAAAGVTEAALASKDVRRMLEAAGVEERLVTRVADWFVRDDGARFGGAQVARAMVDEAVELVDVLADALTSLGRIGA